MNGLMTVKQARSTGFKMLAICPRTRSQIAAALRKKGADENVIAQVLAELLDAGYLNDREYASRYISVRLEDKLCGRVYFQGKLAAAGIERQLAEEVIDEFYPAELEKSMAAKFARFLRERGVDCPQKALRKMSNRGFSGSCARRAVAEEFFTYLDITQ